MLPRTALMLLRTPLALSEGADAPLEDPGAPPASAEQSFSRGGCNRIGNVGIPMLLQS